MCGKVKLGNKKPDVLDVIENNLFVGEDLHPLPEVFVPLACDIVGNDEEDEFADG